MHGGGVSGRVAKRGGRSGPNPSAAAAVRVHAKTADPALTRSEAKLKEQVENFRLVVAARDAKIESMAAAAVLATEQAEFNEVQARRQVLALGRKLRRIHDPDSSFQTDGDDADAVNCAGEDTASRVRRCRLVKKLEAFFDNAVEGGPGGASGIALLAGFLRTRRAVLRQLANLLGLSKKIERETAGAIEAFWTARRGMSLRKRARMSWRAWQRVINFTSKDYVAELAAYVTKKLPWGTNFPSWATHASKPKIAAAEEATVDAFGLESSEDGKAVNFDVKILLEEELKKLDPALLPAEGQWLYVMVIGDATGVFQSTKRNMTSVVLRLLLEGVVANDISNNMHWMLYEGTHYP